MDHFEQIKDLAAKYMQAEKEGVFSKLRGPYTPAAQDRPEDFTSYRGMPGKVDDSHYWNALARHGKHDAPDVFDLLHEGKVETPNPVDTSTFGMDQASVVTPNWINGEDLLKLNKMKLDLHDLGDKLAAADTNIEESKAKGIWGQIKSLQEKIDELSDSLSPNRKQETQS